MRTRYLTGALLPCLLPFLLASALGAAPAGTRAEPRPDALLGEWWTESREGRVRFTTAADGTSTIDADQVVAELGEVIDTVLGRAGGREVAQRVAARPEETRFDPVVCVDAHGAALGIVRVERLLLQLAAAHAG